MKYLLTFKPLKHFFFGNNKTFSDDYLAISEYFPQNTQLLGALRLFIAEQSGLMKVYRSGKWCDKPEELKSITGSATSKDFMTNNDLGKIQNLSQMFIVSKNLDDAYFFIPFDVKVEKETLKYYELASINDDYYLKNYDSKHHQSKYLGNKNFWVNYLMNQELNITDIEQFDYEKDKESKIEKGFFISHSQVGIELQNKQTVKDKDGNGKFYSKIDYQLNDKFLFACVIDLEEKILDDGIIQIGAESSIFDMKIQELETTNIQNHPIISQFFKPIEKADKLVCLSDTILNSTSDLNAKFSIIPYHKSFGMLEKLKEKFKDKTSQKRVIPTGSITYLKDEELPIIQTIGAYEKMGYNQFITVNTKEK